MILRYALLLNRRTPEGAPYGELLRRIRLWISLDHDGNAALDFPRGDRNDDLSAGFHCRKVRSARTALALHTITTVALRAAVGDPAPARHMALHNDLAILITVNRGGGTRAPILRTWPAAARPGRQPVRRRPSKQDPTPLPKGRRRFNRVSQALGPIQNCDVEVATSRHTVLADQAAPPGQVVGLDFAHWLDG